MANAVRTTATQRVPLDAVWKTALVVSKPVQERSTCAVPPLLRGHHLYDRPYEGQDMANSRGLEA